MKKSKRKTPREAARDERKPIGRPTVFTPEVLDKILFLIRNGSTERAIFRMEGMPDWSTWCIFKYWCRDNDKEFIGQLAQATEDWCEFKEAERLEIAEDQSRDVHEWEEITEGPKGVTRKRGASSDNTAVQRDKLRLEAIDKSLKWKLPQRYGDKVEQTLKNPDGSGLSVIVNITRKAKDAKKGS